MNTRTIKTGILTIIFSTALLATAGLPGDWRIRETGSSAHLMGVASAPGQLIVVGHAGTILSSDDGLEWSSMPYDGSGDFHCVTFGKGMYIAGGTFGCLLAASSDGVNWTPVQSTVGQHAHFGVTYGGGRFVAVGRGGLIIPTRIFSSTNGIDWQPASVPPTTNTLRAVTFGNGKYVAVGERGTILTSPDANTWTLQISGTEHLLRSVIFTGREFLAGGDSSLLLTSGDGLSWVTVPFSSFDVRALATSGTAVVGVGGLGAEGRAQSSFDGLSWAESPTVLPSRLNGVVQFNLGRFIAVGNNGLAVDTAAWADTPLNVWTNNASGLWHEAHWLLGHLPSWKDRAIVFTNSGNLTLEINAATTREYSETMQISELILGAPHGFTNTLFLNNAGREVQLLIDRQLQLRTNVALVSVNSALEGSRLDVNGQALFGDNSQIVFRQEITAGVGASGHIVQSNANVAATIMELGGNYPATWQQCGGVTEAYQARVSGKAAYRLQDGTHLVSDILVVYGDYVLEGGTLTTSNITLAGRLHLAGGTTSKANLIAAGGTLTVDGYHRALGTLKLMSASAINFGGTRILEFASSHALQWAFGGLVTISNWTQGSNYLFIGHNQTGLTAAQLSRIRFANPGGFSPGLYSARITSTGEVVPVPKVINYQRSASQLVLSWPEGYRVLTATNVAGPYSLITNAISPYNASHHTDPQRFFIIGNEN